MHLDASQVSFLLRLGKSPDGQQLLGVILAEIESCNEQLRKQSGESLLREQGKAVFLDELKRRLTQDLSARNEPRRPTPFGSTA